MVASHASLWFSSVRPSRNRAATTLSRIRRGARWWQDASHRADQSTDPLDVSVFMMPDGLRVYKPDDGWTLLGGVENWIRVSVLQLPKILAQGGMAYARRGKYTHIVPISPLC